MSNVPWEAIGMVSGGLTLVAFVIAIAAWVYKQRLMAASDLIRTAPDDKRGDLVLAHYGYLVQVDTSNLTRKQKADIINQQLDAKASSYTITATVVVILAVLGCCLTAFAVWQNPKLTETQTRLEEKDKQLEEKEKRLADVESTRTQLHKWLDDVTAKSNELQRNLDIARIRLSRVREGIGGLSVTSDWAEDLAKSNPEISRLADALQLHVAKLRRRFADESFSWDQNLQLRLAEATAKNARGLYEETLELISEIEAIDTARHAENAVELAVHSNKVRGDALLGLRKWRDALACYERLLDLRPDRLYDVQLVAFCHHKLHQLDDAIASLNGLVDRYTWLVEEEGWHELEEYLGLARITRGVVLNDQGKPEAAIQDYDKAMQTFTRLVQEEGRNELENDLGVIHNNRGNAFTEQDDLQAAIQDYDKAIAIFTRLVQEEGRNELENNLASSYNNRGITYRRQDKLDSAILDYDKAIQLRTRLVQEEGRIELENDLARSGLNRGVALRHQGKLQAAIQDYDKSIAIFTRLVQDEGRIELESELAGVYVSRGAALELDAAINDHNKAIAIFTRLVQDEGRIELEDELAAAKVSRGAVLRQQDQLELCLQDYDKAIAIFTRLVQQEGRYELEDELASSHISRGVALRHQGNSEAAITDYRKAIEAYNRLVEEEGRHELEDELAQSHMNCGIALSEQRRPNAALVHFERSIPIFTRLVQEEGIRRFAIKLAQTLDSAAWILATSPNTSLKNREKAVRYSIRACDLITSKSPYYYQCIDTLAAAYAAVGDFDSAIDWASRAFEFAPNAAKKAAVGFRLTLYRDGNPFQQSIQYLRWGEYGGGNEASK